MNPARLLLLLALAASLPAAQAQSGRWPTNTRARNRSDGSGRHEQLHHTHLRVAIDGAVTGQQFIVDNRPGAGGSLGNEIAARAAPDGYTITFVPSSYAATAALYKLPLNPVKGIAPIALHSSRAVPAGRAPVRQGEQSQGVHRARARSARHVELRNAGHRQHAASGRRVFQQMTGSKWVHVPYKGDAPAVADLITGQVHINIATQVVLDAHMRVGGVRPLAVTTEKRSPTMPELPAIAELVPGFAVPGWSGVWAPGGTPREIVTRLNQSLGRIPRAAQT